MFGWWETMWKLEKMVVLDPFWDGVESQCHREDVIGTRNDIGIEWDWMPI